MDKLIVKLTWKPKKLEKLNQFLGEKGNKMERITPCSFKNYLYKATVIKIMCY